MGAHLSLAWPGEPVRQNTVSQAAAAAMNDSVFMNGTAALSVSQLAEQSAAQSASYIDTHNQTLLLLVTCTWIREMWRVMVMREMSESSSDQMWLESKHLISAVHE